MLKTQATTDALKEAIQFVGDLANAGVSLSDGFQLSDLAPLIQAGKDLPAVIRDRALIVPEYMALDDAAKADLLAFIPTAVTVPANVNVERVLEQSLVVVVQLQTLVKAVADLVNELKNPVQPL